MKIALVRVARAAIDGARIGLQARPSADVSSTVHGIRRTRTGLPENIVSCTEHIPKLIFGFWALNTRRDFLEDVLLVATPFQVGGIDAFKDFILQFFIFLVEPADIIRAEI